MEQTRFEQGIEQLRKIDGVGGENVIKSLEDVAPAVGKYIIEFAFGDIYPREVLSFNYEIYSELKKEEQKDNCISKVLPGIEFSVEFIDNKVIHIDGV